MNISPNEARSDGTPVGVGVATHDPVCGMAVDPATARASCVHDGSVVGFCCAGCRGKFLAAPGRYLHANDPVCGALVDRMRPGATVRHEGRRYWFRGKASRERFEADPAADRHGKPKCRASCPAASDA